MLIDTAANIENQRVNRGKGEKCGERVDGGRIRNKEQILKHVHSLGRNYDNFFLFSTNRHRNLRRRYRPEKVVNEVSSETFELTGA